MTFAGERMNLRKDNIVGENTDPEKWGGIPNWEMRSRQK